MKYDVVVVGGGVSGLLSALALSREGKKVVVLEKEKHLGGVCCSYNVDGYRVDTGPHIITRLGHGPLKELMNQYFEVTPIFIPHGKYYVRLQGKVKPFPWNLRDWLSFDLLPPIDRMFLMKTLFSASYIFSSKEDLKRMSVADLVGDGISDETKRFLDCLCGFMTGGTSMAETPVGRFIDSERYKSISEGFLDKLYNILMKDGAADQTYPKGGIKSIIDSIVTSMEGGVTLKCGEEVVGIDAGGKRKEVSSNKDNYTADTIVYSGFASDLPKILDDMPAEYGSRLEKIRRINSMVIWFGLNKKLFINQGSEIWADSKPYSWVVPTSNYDSSLAPKGKQLVGFAFVLPEKYGIKAERKKALEMIYSTLPELERNVDMIHYQLLVPEKAVFTVDTKFADVKTPIDGLYLVGTDTERRSMGVTRASYSVLKLLNALREDRVLD